MSNEKSGASGEPSPLDLIEHQRVVAVVAATAAHGPIALGRLWDDLVTEWGPDVASRLWQEGLSSSDVGQT
jgi:hypothetical protein